MHNPSSPPSQPDTGKIPDRSDLPASFQGIPFPEVRDLENPDSLDSDYANLDGDTSRTLPGGAGPGGAGPGSRRSPDPLLPVPGTRPDGIRVRPKPKEVQDRVKVLVSRAARSLSLYSLGPAEIWADVPGKASKAPGRKLVSLRGRFFVRRAGQGLEVTQAGKPLATVPGRRLRVVSPNPYNLIEAEGTVYRGGFNVLAEGQNELEAVNVLAMEDYLRGVLPYELGTVDRGALEALKALAVVARTYAYKRMQAQANADFHLRSDVQDQVYKGVKAEYLLSDRAVRETQGMVLLHADTLALCYYHSTCGGRTASRHELWGGDSIAYLVSRPDLDPAGNSWCQGSKYSSWTQEWTLPELSAIVKRNLRYAGVADPPAFKSISGMEVVSRAACGRIRLLRITTDRGPVMVKGDKVRWALKPSADGDKILPSAWFDIRISGGQAVAEGKAFGHGIGLCQMGAIGRARANQDFKRIVEAYYLGAQVTEYR